MGVPTVAEFQLQRPSGSGVATATVDRPLSTGLKSDRPKQPRHPPIVLSTPWAVVLEGPRAVTGVVRVFLAPENAPNPPPALAFEYSL